MILTSTREQRKQLIDIFTTGLEKARAELKTVEKAETKIEKAVKTLRPILDQYPEYKSSIANQLGLLLPAETTPKPRLIPIEGDEPTIKPIIVNNNHTSPQPENNNILVEKLQELAQLGSLHNLTININTEKLTAKVLAPHPETKKLYPVVTLSIRSLELSEGWLWLYDINIRGENYHNICYTGSPTDFAEIISNAAKYYFEKQITQLINKLTSDFPQDWKQDKNTNLWKKILTETDSQKLTQNTNKFTGTVELKTENYQWNFQPKTKILTIQKNNNDTTSDNNAETDFTHIEKSGNASTPPTSDMGDIKDIDTANIPNITWYSSSNGEVQVGSKKRYFRLVLDTSTNTHEIKFKKSIDSGKWIQPSKSTEIFASAIEQEFKAGKPDAAEAILQKIYKVAEELGGKLIRSSGSYEVGQFGTLYIPNESIEVGYNDGSWWFIRPGCNKVYCSGDVQVFTETLKGLTTEKSPDSNEVEITKIATAFDTKTENDNKPNTTDTKSKSSDCWYTPPQIVELVEKVLEKIDLDPCSDHGKHIPATTHYTKKDNGLACIWQGKVFINPPYSNPSIWIEKLLSEINDSRVTEAIALLPASTDTKWFQPLWNQPICFWKGRIKFLDKNYQPKSPARQSHCLIYWGENTEKFQQIFSEYGEITLPKKIQETSTLFNQVKPYFPKTWVLENNFFDQVTIRENTHTDSNYVKVTDCFNGEINIHHNKDLLYTASDIETAIDLIYWWFNQTTKTNKLEKFIEIINSYATDLTIIKKDSSTAYIKCGLETWGTIFNKDNQTLELPEREKELLEKSYSIDIKNLIQDINQESDENPHNYLMGIDSLDEELTPRDTLQNALHSFSSHFIWNELNLEVIRLGETFRIYSGSHWLENYLGAITFSGFEIICDEELSITLLDKFSILLEQLIQDILNHEKEIDEQKYILTNKSVKELLLKKGWNEKDFNQAQKLLLNDDNNPTWRQVLHTRLKEQQDLLGINNDKNDALQELLTKKTWNESDFETANNLLNQLTEFSPISNQLIETIRLQRHTLIDSKNPKNKDDDTPNNGGSKTPPPTPKNPNNNGSKNVASSDTKELDTLLSTIKLYNTDLKTQKTHNKITFYQGKYQLGTVEQTTDKLIAEPGLIAKLKLSYGIDLKSLIESIELTAIENCFELDPFEHISSNTNALKQLGCVVAPTSKTKHNRRGKLLEINGELATIQWLNYGVRGDNKIEQVNINSLRYVSARPLTKLDIGDRVKLSNSAWKFPNSKATISHFTDGYLHNTEELQVWVKPDNSVDELIRVNLSQVTPLTETNNHQQLDEPNAESIATLNFSGLIAVNQVRTKKPTANELRYQVNGKSISFGLTLPQLLSGQKTVTRRLWKDSYIKRFLDDWNAKPGEFIYLALTKSYRVGGEKVGHIRITHKPYQEKLADIPTSDLAAEGFPELSATEFIDKFFDGDDQQIVWVIQFEFIPNSTENQDISLKNVAITQDSTKNQDISLENVAATQNSIKNQDISLKNVAVTQDSTEKPNISSDNVAPLQEENLTTTEKENENTNNHTTDLLDKLAQTFESFNDIHTKRLGDALWFYQGEKILHPCYLKQLDQEITLLPSLEVEIAMEKMFGIDIAKICFDIEAGLSVDINDYINQSIWSKTTNNTDIKPTKTSQKSKTNEVLSDEKLTENTEKLRWVKDDSMYARTESYIVWKGSQKCGKIHKFVAKKSNKRKANNGKWYVNPNVVGPYYDTIEEAAHACWKQLKQLTINN